MPLAERSRPLGRSLADALLFAALGLVPAGALGAVGLRALEGEAAAVHREAAQLVEGAARGVERAVDRSLDDAAAELAALALDEPPETEAAARALLERVRPPVGGEPVALGFPRAKAPAAAAPAERADRCAALGREVLRSGRDDGFTAACAEASDASGRWLFPIFAAAPPAAPLAAELAPWMSEHGALLSAAERAGLERDAEAVGDPGRRAAVERALRATPVGSTSPAARRAAELGARRWPDARGLATWSEAGARGVLRPLDRARALGFVVHRAPLEAALRAPSAPAGLLPPDVVARWDGGGSGPSATATIAPGLSFVVAHARGDVVERRARRQRWIVGTLLGGAASVVVALGALVLVRVRQMRRTSELRTDFVAAVSHELRTPVGSIRMLAELLAEGRVAEDERAEVQDALAREARRLSDTIARLLELRRMLAGRGEAKLERADVASLVEEAIDELEERAPDMPRVLRALEHVTAPVDRALLRLAVDNLLANARRHAPDGAPYEVAVARRGARVVISVTDHGPGVARRDRERIFAPFERADDRLSRATEGFGIGLALVRWAAEQHGGEASFEGEEGRGATFVISLPVPPEARTSEDRGR